MELPETQQKQLAEALGHLAMTAQEATRAMIGLAAALQAMVKQFQETGAAFLADSTYHRS